VFTELNLVQPTLALAESHDALIADFHSHQEELVPWVLDEVGDNFAGYLKWMKQQSQGIGLNEGFVPNSTFWLVGNGEILGVTNIRHKLTPSLLEYGGHVGYGVRPSARRQGCATKMLELSLVELRKHGVDNVRVTCVKENIASAKTILNNGGVLDSEEFMPEHDAVIQRYWVPNE